MTNETFLQATARFGLQWSEKYGAQATSFKTEAEANGGELEKEHADTVFGIATDAATAFKNALDATDPHEVRRLAEEGTALLIKFETEFPLAESARRFERKPK